MMKGLPPSHGRKLIYLDPSVKIIATPRYTSQSNLLGKEKKKCRVLCGDMPLIEIRGMWELAQAAGKMKWPCRKRDRGMSCNRVIKNQEAAGLLGLVLLPANSLG